MTTLSNTSDRPPKQALFVQEYLKDFNATQAAVRAGYSHRSARSIANELLTKPDIRADLSKAVEERCSRAQVDATWLLVRLVEELNADLVDLFYDDGRLKPPQEWPEVWRRGLVSSMELEERETTDDNGCGTSIKVVRLRFSDRVRRLELIGRHVDVGAFRDRVQHDIADPLAELARQIGGRSIRPRSKSS